MKQNYIKNEKAMTPVIGTILMVLLVVILAAVIATYAFGQEDSMESKLPPNIYFTNIKISELNGLSATVSGTDTVGVGAIKIRYGINGGYPTNEANITSPTDYITGGIELTATMTSPDVKQGDRVSLIIIYIPSGTILIEKEDIMVSG